MPDAAIHLTAAQLAKRFTYDDAKRLATSFDGGKERDAILDGVLVLQRSLREVGFAPR